MSIASKPNYGSRVSEKDTGTLTQDYQTFFDDLEELLNTNLLGKQVQLPSYTVTTLPVATTAAGLIFVSNETGGAVPAFSDGANWRRVTDRVIVS